MARTSVLQTVRQDARDGSIETDDQYLACRTVRRSSTRPDVAPLNYSHAVPAPRALRADRREVGFGTLCGIALVTAALSLGMVAVANLRAADQPAPAAPISVVDGAR